MLVLHSTATNKCQVYAIDTSQPRLPIKFLVDFQYPRQWGLGFVASKSTLNAVGGELECNDKGLGKFPTDVQSCDLKDWRKKDSFRWESGPEFSGRKPSPVLVPLDGNIYAHARGTCHLTQSGCEADPQKNPFEVFRPGCGWEPLLDPPFTELYSKSCHPFFEISTVIDKKNYVGFEALRKEGHDPKKKELYSFDVASVSSEVNGWKHISLEDPSCDVRGRNLLKCNWKEGFMVCGMSEVANNLMFRCTRGFTSRDETDVEVFAWDLAAKLEETPAQVEPVVKVEKEKSTESYSATTLGKGNSNGFVRRLKSYFLGWECFPR